MTSIVTDNRPRVFVPDFNRYQQLALITKAPGDKKRDILHAAIGLSSEVGELRAAELNFDLANEKEEIGDCCWYIAIACEALKISMEAVYHDATYLGPYPNKNAINIDILVVEAANFLDLAKRWEFYDKQASTQEFMAPMTWVLSALARRAQHRLDTPLLTLCDDNIVKLQGNAKFKGRYEQFFSTENAVNRDLDGERKVFTGEK